MSNINTPSLPLALYIHWPYCLSKCPYCDFNSHVTDHVDHKRWRAAYEADLKAHKAQLGDRRISSIFFGGGTPSLMQAETVAHIIDTARKLWDFNDDIEITLEANPTSIEAGKFADFAAAGINRVSVGVQAMNDRDLKALGREHSADEALVALDIAATQFDRFSFDLIYTRENQSIEAWKAELQHALPFAKAGHMSLYQLTIEAGTQFKTLFDSGRLILPDDDESARFYEATLDITDSANLPLYEISNYAAKGQESQHNLTYWRYGDYAGIGPGAHGRLRVAQSEDEQARLRVAQSENEQAQLRVAQYSDKAPSFTTISTRAHKAPDIWLDHVLRDTHHEAPFQNAQSLSPQEQFEEMMLVGLRLREGITYDQVMYRTDINPHNVLKQETLNMLAVENLLRYDKNGVSLTTKGFPLLDAITRALLS